MFNMIGMLSHWTPTPLQVSYTPPSGDCPFRAWELLGRGWVRGQVAGSVVRCPRAERTAEDLQNKTRRPGLWATQVMVFSFSSCPFHSNPRICGASREKPNEVAAAMLAASVQPPAPMRGSLQEGHGLRSPWTSPIKRQGQRKLGPLVSQKTSLMPGGLTWPDGLLFISISSCIWPLSAFCPCVFPSFDAILFRHPIPSPLLRAHLFS